jgi:4-hydroxy-tetrahydrodipicolinate synthase
MTPTQELARWLVAQGNDGLVVCGTTGESPTLSDEEKLSIFAAVVEAVDVPVVAGTVGADTAHMLWNCPGKLQRLAWPAFCLCVPYYNRPSQAGIEGAPERSSRGHIGLPNLIYDIPVRTGRKISTEVLVKRGLGSIPMWWRVKDAAGNPAETARSVTSLAPSRFSPSIPVTMR